MATGTQGDAGKVYHTNQTHYIARRISYADIGTDNTAVVVGVLPPRAVVFYGHTMIVTGFDDTNGDDLDIGISGGDDNWFASSVDLNSATTLTTFDDLTGAEAYSTSARTVTANFSVAPTGNGTAGEAFVFLEFYVAPSVSQPG